MSVKLHVDLETLQLIQGPGLRSAVNSLRFKRGDAARLQVVFLENGISPVPIGDPDALEIQIGIKPRNQFDHSYLAHSADWSMPAEGDDTPTYECELSFNTLQLNSALNVGSATAEELPEITLMGEITWQEGNGEPTSTRTFLVVVENDVNRGDEGAPTDANPVYPPPQGIEMKVNKGAANGYAPLGAGGQVPYVNIPPVRPSDIHGVTQYHLLGNYNESGQPFPAEPVGLGGGLTWMSGFVVRDELTGAVTAGIGSNVTTLAANISGNKSFTSFVRPTSSGTGTPGPTSLITAADGDGRYGRQFSGISIDSVSSSNTTPIKVASVLLPIGLYYIDSLVSSIHGGGLCTIGLITNQPLGINVIESHGNDQTAHITNPIGADGFASSARSAVAGTTFSRRVTGIVQITTGNTELSIQFSQSVANATPSVTRKRAYITATKLN
jgi:hypothetical protein